MLYESKGLKTVLNAGYRYGGYVSRAVPSPDGGYVMHKFSVFCPKMFAGIAGRRLPITGATLSRCVQIPMRTRTPDEEIEKFKHRVARVESEPIHEALVAWAERKIPVLSDADPAIPTELSDRQEECWEPLIAIADDLGGTWPERARKAAVVLSGRLVKAPTEGRQIITDVKQAWERIDGDRAHTAMLAAERNALVDRLYQGNLSSQDLSWWLMRFEIHPEPNPFRLNGRLGRGYRREVFADAFRRYTA